jgi:hypothetical protein
MKLEELSLEMLIILAYFPLENETDVTVCLSACVPTNNF